MGLELDNGISASQVADVGVRVADSACRYFHDVRGTDTAVRQIMHSVALTVLAIQGLDKIFQHPLANDVRRDEATRTAKKAIEACWTLFPGMETALNEEGIEKSVWPFEQKVAELVTRAECLKSTLELLRRVLECPRQDVERGKTWMIEDLVQDNIRAHAAYAEAMAGKRSGQSVLQREDNTTGTSNEIEGASGNDRGAKNAASSSLPEPRADIEDPRLEADTMKEEREVPAQAYQFEGAPNSSWSDLDKCISHVHELLGLVQELRNPEGGLQSPQDIAEDYARIRKELDSIILGEQDERPSTSRRRSFQMAPVRDYIHRAKYSWKDWFLLSSIIKSKKEPPTIPELHEGTGCSFQRCEAHCTSRKERPHLASTTKQGEDSEKLVFEMPGDIPSHTTASPGEQPNPSVRFLSPTPGPLPNHSLTTIYTNEDDSSSCRSCSSRESVSSFCLVGEGGSEGKASYPTKEGAPAATPATSALAESAPRIPTSAQDALRMWTTLLD